MTRQESYLSIGEVSVAFGEMNIERDPVPTKARERHIRASRGVLSRGGRRQRQQCHRERPTAKYRGIYHIGEKSITER